MKKVFRPEEWVPEDARHSRLDRESEMPDQVGHDEGSKLDDVEMLTQMVEARRLDITSDYHRWLNIGFALVEGLGEYGRNFFHRLSRSILGTRSLRPTSSTTSVCGPTELASG